MFAGVPSLLIFLGSLLELLHARRSELANRWLALQVRAAQYQSTVGLIRVLGGG